ncbi:hypothetical protein BASA81_002038 [Batrachochytrium salamandrivorans]|nr:hypothetical protein BASA81_002038 [Batrachochytrium salamandrivorans]
MKGMRLGREKTGSSVGKKAPKPDKLYKQKNKAEKSSGLDSSEVAQASPLFVDCKCDAYDHTLPHLQSKLIGCGVTVYLHEFGDANGWLDNTEIWGMATSTFPRRANKLGESEHEELLDAVANKPGLVAVCTGVQYGKQPFGEPKPCCDSEYQKVAFGVHCRFALKHSLPMVLSISPDCRDERENARALADLKSWLDEYHVPKTHKLYFCSWVGSVPSALGLLKLYPNAIIGLNGAITFRSNDHLREAAFDLPLDRLVLESDAPNNPPSELLLPHSSWTVLVVAQCVAAQKKLTVEQVLMQTNATAAMFFGRKLREAAKEEEEEPTSPPEQQSNVDLQELAKYLE